ncbi:hypothetical protein [Rhizobium leguminosarum]|uniref:hypothetical protein n=1 Tax=Rhizobium leguminosarum TaxID=384 RepID=UPI001C981ED4|nr:hypothetical protein [Rhizobium leguminosarum]MBY5809388.1 hypothetical protein [Rhizobium leguminosarum]
MNHSGEIRDRVVFDDEWRGTLLRSLTDVGPSKAVGYLPLYTIKRFLKTTPKALATSAASRGLAAARFTSRACRIKSGALYVYDRTTLTGLLQGQAEAVGPAGLPLNADAFVAHIAAVLYDEDHPAYGFIAAAFGQQPFEVR